MSQNAVTPEQQTSGAYQLRRIGHMTNLIGSLTAAAILVACPIALAQADPEAQVADAQKLIQSGDLRSGIKSLQAVVASTPDSFEARLALGRALDLDGRHDQARTHLEEAVRLASDEERTTALAALGISYAFQARPDESARYYQRAFDMHMQGGDRRAAAALANALGRIYLESGNLDKAEQWYTTGYETSQDTAGRTAAEAALWEMRRHNAFGRIAARRGNRAAALEHAAAVKALLDKGGNDDQQPFYPYLLGYIAYFSKDYKQAIAHLLQGDLEDPFVLGLIGQAHQRLRQREAAAKYYRLVMASPAHNINTAFARPVARAALR
jgi:tetratricopeptide (TPR) repeat protein